MGPSGSLITGKGCAVEVGLAVFVALSSGIVVVAGAEVFCLRLWVDW